jgi:GNAT superfamily N-acetyltransferase
MRIQSVEATTYNDELIAMLRRHNRQFTDDMSPEAGYLVAWNNDAIVGIVRYTKSWNWVGWKEFHTSDPSVVNALVDALWDRYPAAGGILHYTDDATRITLLQEGGFHITGVLPATPLMGAYHYLNAPCSKGPVDPNIRIQDTSELGSMAKSWWDVQDASWRVRTGPIPEEIPHCLVLTNDDTLLGGVLASQTLDTLHVSILVVDESIRGRGMGRRLMEELEAIARSRGIVQISLGTTTFQARGFYERLGYRHVMTQKECPKEHDCFTLVKVLLLD